ncbi:MAG: MBL fold metallo-hydrolase [Calditrichaeota bacterium]|nr:MBL fold metallo-hydrolase [Calditrichota bacterium]
MRWRRERKNSGRPQFAEVVGTLPVTEPNWWAIDPPGDSLVVTWIGQATFLLQMDGLNILTDPIFSERCSPVQFAGSRRVTPMPLDPARLPGIDYVLISHSHYDHLDKGAVRLLGNGPTWLVPLGLKAWFTRQGITKVVELDWWDQAGLVNGGAVVCVPARHFSSRRPWDRNKTLWAGWVVTTPRRKVYFAGDTGYGPHFAEISERTGPPDLALLPIGAYRPEWFMLPIHLNPRQAVRAHLDLRAERTIGMHWGTFILSDEPLLEPPRLFRRSARLEGLSDEEIIVLQHGQTIIIP